jgi:hypothetical protein
MIGISDLERAQWRFTIGDRVVTTDDHTLGTVRGFYPAAATPTHLIVEQGRLVHHDAYVPISAVANYAEGTIYLGVAKDEGAARGWEAGPWSDLAHAAELDRGDG